MKPILILVTLVTSFSTYAQFFVQQLAQDQILQNEKAYVVTIAGDTLRGKITNQSLANGFLTGFTLKSGGEKIKMKVHKITTLAIIPSVFATHDDMPLITTLQNAEDEAFLTAVETEWVIFDRIQLPGKEEMFQLTQRLNPGFDEHIKVYKDVEQGGSTWELSSEGTSLMGGLDMQHLVTIDGGKSFRVKKRKYEERFEKLYGDCEAIQSVSKNWNDFAKHIYIFNSQCE